MTPEHGSRPLDLSNFAFVGYDGLLGSLEQTILPLRIRTGVPTVRIVEGGVWVPASKVGNKTVPGGPRKNQAGILDVDGFSVTTAHVRRAGGKLVAGLPDAFSVEPKDNLDEEVVYLGWLFGHYGHFLLESLARTWILADVDPSARVLFHHDQQVLKIGWVHQILSAFGIPRSRILSPHVPTRVRRIIIPEPLYELSYAAHERIAESFREVAARIVGGCDCVPYSQPVYLSRRLLRVRTRRIVGEDDLEAVLRENGFLIVYPETMKFADQIRLFNQYVDIFTTDGSAAHTALFAHHSLRLHHLAGGRPLPDYFLVPAVAGTAASFVNCLSFGGRPTTVGKTPQLLDLEVVIPYLEERGFLKTRLRASLASRGDTLRERYNEAWFYTHLDTIVARGRSISHEEELEVLQLAISSWPLLWLLIRYCVYQHPASVNALAEQFAILVDAESDVDRLAQHYVQIKSTAGSVLSALELPTRDVVIRILHDRFRIRSKDLYRAGGHDD